MVMSFAVCCARAPSGHAAAAPSSVMNSRRLIRSTRRRLQKFVRYAQPERLGGFEVDDQLEFCRLLDGQIGGHRAFEDFGNVDFPSSRYASGMLLP